jgi:EAL domain-containing protein (putative c-di-GMP-specific phosphodiesterase class I)
MRVVEKLLLHLREHKLIGTKVRYCVNLSRVSISDQNWTRRLVNMLSGSEADPAQLVFGITESVAMSEIDTTIAFTRKLKALGCRFALDNFGAGFSSFYYLKRFDVDYLKIDGSFARDLAADDSNRLFVKALNDVATGMGKQVIAQWVETPATLKLLEEIGAQYGQGYLFRRPTPLSAEPDSSLACSLVGAA